MVFPIFLILFAYFSIIGCTYSLIWFFMSVDNNVLIFLIATFGFFFIKGEWESYNRQYQQEIRRKDAAERFNALVKEMIEKENE